MKKPKPLDINFGLKDNKLRILEVFEALGVYTAIIKHYENDKNSINQHPSFIRPVIKGLLTTIITGITSTLDPDRSTTSLLIIQRHINENQKGSLPENFFEKPWRIYKKYSKYRNQLIGHINKDYQNSIEEFNNLKLTIKEIHNDAIEIAEIFKQISLTHNTINGTTNTPKDVITEEHDAAFTLSKNSTMSLLNKITKNPINK